MLYSIQEIIQILKTARKKKGLSQRALSTKIGVPQSHLSKIESGRVDIQLSSLIQLARILDLELMLVPKKLVAAVNAIQKGGELKGEDSFRSYILDDEEEDV
jgi:transcriptional regulator with XRE-family HTH domain